MGQSLQVHGWRVGKGALKENQNGISRIFEGLDVGQAETTGF